MDIRKRNNGSQMASALNQEKPKPLRNHAKSNAENLRALQERNRDQKVIDAQQKIDDAKKYKSKQFENVKPRLLDGVPVQDENKHEFLKKNTVKPEKRPASRESTSRLPSRQGGELAESKRETVPRAADCAPAPKKAVTRNFIKENTAAAKDAHKPEPVSEQRPKSFQKGEGNVPTYISDMKNKINADKRQQSEALDSVPPGYRVLGEDERLETLAQLKIKHAEAEAAWVKLPLKIETEGQKARQATLQKEMAEFERLRKLFDKPRVLVEL